MTLHDKLLNIKSELVYRNPKELFDEGVNIKLVRSQNNYTKALKANCAYILSRSNYKAMMAIDKHTRYKEKNKNDKKINYGFVKVIKP